MTDTTAASADMPARKSGGFTLSKGVIFFTGIIAVLFAALVAVSNYRQSQSEIGSKNYSLIVEGKDLIADILPPPAFAIEAYVQVLETAQNPSRAPEAFEKFKAHKAEFQKRMEYWRTADIPEGIRQRLIGDAAAALTEFWTLAETEFFPSLIEQQLAANTSDPKFVATVGKIDASFQEHKAIVEEIVASSETYLGDVETAAADIMSLTGIIYMIVVGLSLLLVGSMIFLFNRKVVKPMSTIAAYTVDLAAGRDVGDVPHVDRSDEVGDVANALTEFRKASEEIIAAQNKINEERERADQVAREAAEERAKEAQTTTVVKTIGESLRKLASGDLTCTIETPFNGELDQLRVDLNDAIAQFSETFKGIVNTTNSLGTGVREIVTASDDLSVRTEKQAAALEETAATLNQITETVKKSAEGAENTQAIVENAKQDAQTSGEVVEKALSAMTEIENSAKEINQIISVIDEIAFQTNLLALNAGVEAARAGDAGQGFAVVASEVRALAQRSATAAKEIKDLISKSTEQVAGGSKFVGATGETLQRIADQVLQISSVVDEIAEGAKEQSSSLNELNVAVAELDSGTQQNAAMAEEATAACHSLRAEADELTSVVSKFKIDGAASRPNLHAVPSGKSEEAATASSPAKSLMTKVAGAFGGKSAAAAVAVEEDWQEF